MDEWIKANALSLVALMAAVGSFVGVWSVVRARVADNRTWIRDKGDPHVNDPVIHEPRKRLVSRDVCDERFAALQGGINEVKTSLNRIFDILEGRSKGG